MSRSQLLEALARDDERALRNLLVADPELAVGHTDSGVSFVLAARYLGMQQSLVSLVEFAGPLDMPEAAATGDAQRVRELLDAASDDRARAELANIAAPDGYTSLHLAVFFGHPDISRALIDAGANVIAVADNDSKVTPLHSAVAGGEHICVRQLLDAGADANAQQTGGHTALDIAIAIGDEDMAAQLRDAV